MEVATVKLMRERFGPRGGLRIDPNAAWSVETSIRVAEKLRDTDLEYLEDPTANIEGMAQVARHTPIPLSTNMCVTAFEHIPMAFRERAVQVVLGDHHGWGGLTAFRHLGVICKTLGWGLSQHSNSHLGISFAAMIHAGAAIPNLIYASDTHYPWNAASDVVRETDLFRFHDGTIDAVGYARSGRDHRRGQTRRRARGIRAARRRPTWLATTSARCASASPTGCRTCPSGELRG